MFYECSRVAQKIKNLLLNFSAFLSSSRVNAGWLAGRSYIILLTSRVSDRRCYDPFILKAGGAKTGS